MVTAPAPPVGKTPPLEEPPAPPVPHLRLNALKGRARKLRGRAPRGPHLRDIFGRPGPGAHKREVKKEAEQRAKIQAKVQRQQQPGPVAVAAGAATGPIVEHTIKRAKEKREARKREAPPLGPLNAEQRKRAREKLDDLNQKRTRRGRRPESKVREAGERAAHENVPLRHGHGFPPGPGVKMEPAPGEGAAPPEEPLAADLSDEELVEKLDRASARAIDKTLSEDERAQAAAQRATLNAQVRLRQQRGLDYRMEQEAVGHAGPPIPQIGGPPRASDKTSGEIRADATAIIGQWEHIAANEELPRSQRLLAQRRADELRRIAEKDKGS